MDRLLDRGQAELRPEARSDGLISSASHYQMAWEHSVHSVWSALRLSDGNGLSQGGAIVLNTFKNVWNTCRSLFKWPQWNRPIHWYQCSSETRAIHDNGVILTQTSSVFCTFGRCPAAEALQGYVTVFNNVTSSTLRGLRSMNSNCSFLCRGRHTRRYVCGYWASSESLPAFLLLNVTHQVNSRI